MSNSKVSKEETHCLENHNGVIIRPALTLSLPNLDRVIFIKGKGGKKINIRRPFF